MESVGDAATGENVVVEHLTDTRLHDLSFGIGAGEILGVAGLIGSGAEELPYLLFGAQRPSPGTLRIGAETLDIGGLSPQRSVRERVALVPADRAVQGLSQSLTLWENIVMLVEDEHYRGGVFHRGELVALAGEAIDRFLIRPPLARNAVSTFSGGNQQKALLAKWLLARPRLLLLHEPTQGVDVGARRDIYRFVKSAAALNHMAVLWVTTEFGELAEVCDRVIVITQGRQPATLAGEELSEEAISAAALRQTREVTMSAPHGAAAPVETERPAEPAVPAQTSVLQRLGLQRYVILIVFAAMIVAFGLADTLDVPLDRRPLQYPRRPGGAVHPGDGRDAADVMGDFVDLSLGSSLGLSAMTLAVLNVNHGTGRCSSPAWRGSARRLIVGLVNVFFVVYFDNDPFIVTLGTMTIVQGVIYIISGNNSVGIVSTGLSNWIFGNDFLPIPLEFYYGLAIFLVVWYVLSFTPVGQKALVIGQSREVARLSGVRVNRQRAWAYIIGAAIAGIAGIAYAGTNGTVDPTAGSTLILPAYAAVFLGATAIKPGRINAARRPDRGLLPGNRHGRTRAAGHAELLSSRSSTAPPWSWRSRCRR